MTTTYFFSLRVIEDDRGVFVQWGNKERDFPGKTAKEILPPGCVGEDGRLSESHFHETLKRAQGDTNYWNAIDWFWSQLPEPE